MFCILFRPVRLETARRVLRGFCFCGVTDAEKEASVVGRLCYSTEIFGWFCGQVLLLLPSFRRPGGITHTHGGENMSCSLISRLMAPAHLAAIKRIRAT